MTRVCHMHTPTPSPLTETIIACWAKKKTCVGVGCDRVCEKRFHCELSLMLGGHINPTKIRQFKHATCISDNFLHGCYENSDLRHWKIQTPWASRKQRPPENLRPPKSQIPGCLENSVPQYFSNIATNYRPRAASLSLSHLQKRNFVLQKYRLSESSHWQNFDNTKFCWRFVMRSFVRIVTFDEVFKLRGQICWWSLNLFSSKSCQKDKNKPCWNLMF